MKNLTQARASITNHDKILIKEDQKEARAVTTEDFACK